MWYLQESNQGHTDFQSVALPTELRYQHPDLTRFGCKFNRNINTTKRNIKKLKYIRDIHYLITFIKIEFSYRHRQYTHKSCAISK